MMLRSENDGSPVGGGADTDDAYACGGGGSSGSVDAKVS